MVYQPYSFLESSFKPSHCHVPSIAKERIMEETPSNKDELRLEYTFDYNKAKPNRFATTERTVVVLDEELSKVFKTPESVERALRAVLEAMPPKSSAL